MKFSRLLRESRLFWPHEIRIDDGGVEKGGGGYFPTLSAIWDDVEVRQNEINEWHSLMSWIVFCGFYKAACERKKAGNAKTVRFSELDQKYMATKLAENLKAVYPSFPRQMRSQYIDDTKS